MESLELNGWEAIVMLVCLIYVAIQALWWNHKKEKAEMELEKLKKQLG